MAIDENAVKTLTELGLTVLEARIYFTLCQYESLSTKAVNELTKIAQPDTYRVIAKLQNKGLVEKIIDDPARFKAVPFETGVALLLNRKTVECDGLKVKAKLLISAFKQKKSRSQAFDNSHSEFSLIPQTETIVKSIQKAIDRSEKNVDMFISWKRFAFGISTAFSESSERAWARGVKFRMIVEKPEKRQDLDYALQFCRKSPFCNIRFLGGRPKAVIGIYDEKEVFIILNPKAGLFDSPALWSNNQSLLSVVQDYFNTLWLAAMEEPNWQNQKFSSSIKGYMTKDH